MAQLVACPKCTKPLQVPDELLGKKVQCPECKHTFTATVADAVEDDGKTGTTTAPSKVLTVPKKKPAWEKQSADDSDDDIDIVKKKKRRRDEDDDDDDDDDDRPSRRSRRASARRGNYVPHRGGMILAFGIIGLVGGFALWLPAVFGIIAWIMGNSDLEEIRQGRMDPEGEGMTQTGRILGMIATILFIVSILMACGVFVFYLFCFAMVVGGAAANMNKNFPPPKGRP